jgi:phosphotransferase system HPr-like phosphotransfer protein
MNQDESRKTVKEEWIMKKTTVMLDSISAVKNFVNIVTAYDFEVDLASGRYAVDAKSIMGIFSLDLSKPIQLTAHTDDADKFFNEIRDYIVG